MYYYQDGLGSSLGGDETLAMRPIAATFKVWYVNSATGVDDINHGANPSMPAATIGYAIGTLASDYDWIVLGNTHDETLSSTLAIGKNVKLIGCGSSAGVPSAKLRFAAPGGQAMLNITGSAGATPLVELRNIHFPASTNTNVAAFKVSLAVTSGQVNLVGCRFDAGEFDNTGLVNLAAGFAGRLTIDGCTLKVTNTNVNARPGVLLRTAGGSPTWIKVRDTVFDAGVTGCTGYEVSIDSNVTAQCEIDCDLLNGADITSVWTRLSGYISAHAVSGGAKVSVS